MTEAELSAVWDDLERLPPLLRRVCLADAPLELLAGKSLLDHPRYGSKTGDFPGRPGYRWSDMAGIAEPDATIVLVNHNLAWHAVGGSLTLHEIAHQFDRRCGWPSRGTHWVEIYRKAPWNRQYAADFPAEAFADAWSAYFYSAAARAALPPEVRSFIRELVRSPKWLQSANLDAEAIPSAEMPSRPRDAWMRCDNIINVDHRR